MLPTLFEKESIPSILYSCYIQLYSVSILYWYKLSRMVPFSNFAGINFRDRMEFWWNSLILTPFLVFLVDISITPMKVIFRGHKLSWTPKNREIAKVYTNKEVVLYFLTKIEPKLYRTSCKNGWIYMTKPPSVQKLHVFQER